MCDWLAETRRSEAHMTAALTHETRREKIGAIREGLNRFEQGVSRIGRQRTNLPDASGFEHVLNPMKKRLVWSL